MDHLDNLRVFVAVAEGGSLAEAARRREISAPAATRALAALEKRLGAALIVRTTRSLRLTEVGEQFLADTRQVLASLDAAEAAVTGLGQRPQGQLAVTAPELFGQRHVAPLLFEFLGRHPEVNARVFFSNRVVHLIDEGFDVALRIATLPDSGLTAVPVGQMRVVRVAAPAYLAQRGEPQSPADLARHQGVGFAIEGQGRIGWGFGDAERPESERLVVNSNVTKVAATVAGLGITRALAYQVTDEVRDGRLRIILAAHEPPPVPVHLVYPGGRLAAAKVRHFVQFAAERLRALPLLQGAV
ncbi:LysR family transcriptional regulator [Roseateles paludis]|uniref:LysR family transcriptional regulator n=1 Tax=Roseateles paludis TaxID=3145238 RepID=A0ABV0FYU2_9BURK